MLIFKILLIILVASPFIVLSGFLFWRARDYSVKLNLKDKYRRKNSGEYPEFTGNNRYSGFSDFDDYNRYR